MNRLKSRMAAVTSVPGLLPALGLALAALVLSVAPLLLRGFAMGHDWSFELVRIAEFRHAIEEGQWPPYWASNLYQGFGSPIFLFYPPLYLTVAAALSSMGVGLMPAAVGALCLFTAIGGLLIWRFVRSVAPGCPAAAAVAVVLFALHPYLLADKWIRNANAEFAALSLLPGVLIGATSGDPRRRFWWTAISLALVVLSHNIVALVAVTVALGVAIFVHRTIRALVSGLAAVFAALALTAFFWVPAFMLQPLIRTEDLLRDKFDFHTQFPSLGTLVWPAEFYSGGWIAPVLLALLIFAPVADARRRRIARALALGAAACLVLMLPVSTSIWEMLPLLRFTQFPWRFLGPMAVLLAAGAGVLAAPVCSSRWPSAILALIFVLAVLNALPAIQRYESVAPEYASRIDRVMTPQGIASRDLRTTVYDEYLPRSANPSELQDAAGFRLFKRWAFPVWTATRNGNALQPATGPGGVVAVPIDSDDDKVELALREPSVRTMGKILSIAALTGFAALVALQRWRRPAS